VTANELYIELIHIAGDSVEKPMPECFEVDHETYANVCQSVLDWAVIDRNKYFNWDGFEDRVSVAIGKHNGIMFKGVELILRKS
jgi:hypothetical protein